ncbi:MAG: VIT domain-containing protein [Desulfatiglandales bacterium]
MRYISRILGAVVFAGFFLSGFAVYAQPETNGSRTLSPYFYVKSDDPEADRLPLKSTSVHVNISGVMADVLVTQVYKNEGRRPLEAIYIFPASTRAAVYGMKMTIGERTITAKIAEREDARRQYENAKQAGKSASLLEQQRPNVFQMSVANILPSDVITVELRYTELVVPTDAVYEFVYPTVVGPRYTNQKADDANPWQKWTHNPYLHQGESPTYIFHMGVNLSAGLPIQDVTCSSHKVDISYDGPALSHIKLDPSEKYGGNRDFILKYRLAGGRIETGLSLFEGEEENFFLLMVQPPKRVTERQIPPREYVFIVDVSGSMNGFPLDISKRLLKDLIGKLRPNDKFNVLLFAGGSSLMSKQSLPATPENIRRAISIIERQRGGGGTQLLPALRRALALPRTEGYSRSVVIATDGYVSVEEETFDLIRHNLGNANMFAFGIGSSVNRHIIEGMARVGMGEPFVITKPEKAMEKAKKFRELIQSPVLTGIKIDFGGFEVYDVEPPSIPDVLADRPVIVFGKWRGRPKGHIELRGSSGDRPFIGKIDVADVEPMENNSALRYLWARHRIALLSDYNRLSLRDERVREVTSLGLTYNLLTAYTSFVAIDAQVRLVDGQAVTVKQPLPLPQGVSNLAVGNGRYAKSMAQSFAAPLPNVARESSNRERWLAYKAEDSISGLKPPAADSRKIRMEVRRIAVSEGLAERSVKSIIENEIGAINNCYKAASGRQFNLKGEVVFTLVVTPEGRVMKVSMEKGKNKDKHFEQCMTERLKALQFPSQAGRKTVKVTITIVLT